MALSEIEELELLELEKEKYDSGEEPEVIDNSIEERKESDDLTLGKITKELSSILEKYSEKDRQDKNKEITSNLTELIRKEYLQIEKERIKVSDEINKNVISQLPKLVRKEVNLTPPIQNIVERVIEKQVIRNIPAPKDDSLKEKVDEISQKIKETKKYVEKDSLEALKKEVAELRKVIDDTKEILPMIMSRGGSGVLGLPNPQDHSGQFLTTDGNAFSWATVTASSSSDPLYVGDPNTDGSWRFTTSLAETAGTLEVQKRIAGVWTKSAFWEQP